MKNTKITYVVKNELYNDTILREIISGSLSPSGTNDLQRLLRPSKDPHCYELVSQLLYLPNHLPSSEEKWKNYPFCTVTGIENVDEPPTAYFDIQEFVTRVKEDSLEGWENVAAAFIADVSQRDSERVAEDFCKILQDDFEYFPLGTFPDLEQKIIDFIGRSYAFVGEYLLDSSAIKSSSQPRNALIEMAYRIESFVSTNDLYKNLKANFDIPLVMEQSKETIEALEDIVFSSRKALIEELLTTLPENMVYEISQSATLQNVSELSR